MAEQALSIGQNAVREVSGPDPRCAAFVKKRQDGLCELELMIEGIHCASCIGKIESAMRAEAAVREARLNFSTRRLRVAWSGPPAAAGRIVKKIEDMGYGVTVYEPRIAAEKQEDEDRFLLLCMGVAGFAAGNIMLLSFALWTTSAESMGIATRDFLHWISAIIAIPAIAYSGRPFFYSALGALKGGRANMDVPISLALILATGMSVVQLFAHAEDAYFDSAVMLMFFLLVGRYLDFRARARARGAASDLLRLMTGAATVIEEGNVRLVPISALEEGMTVSVAMGERIPADAIILSGQSDLDVSLLTGETIPVPVAAGDRVHSGAVNVTAPLTVRIEKKAGDSFLADIVRLMEKAEQGQAGYVRLADKVSRLYTPAVHALAAASFIGWFFIAGAPWQDSLLVAITVLIITCPCALGLAVPVVQVLAVGRLMKEGIMVKSGDALERLAAVDTVFFDKTGTLTMGRPALCNAGEISSADLKLAASLARHSRHPLSAALAAFYKGPVYEIEARELPGRGLQAQVHGKTVRLGSRKWCGPGDDAAGADMPELWLHAEGAAPVLFLFTDEVRADAADVVRALENRKKEVHLLSGDRVGPVRKAALALGIGIWHAALGPQEKLEILGLCRARGKKILMVGDGLNDAPVLAGADVSMSPSSAIDISQNAADIVFTGNRLRPVITAYDTAHFSCRLVKQNFALSIVYNLFAVPLAAMGYVTPLVAALAMSSSSLLVVLNSFRLVRKK